MKSKRRSDTSRNRKDRAKKQSNHIIDLPLLGCTLILLIIGVVSVLEASVVEAYHQFGDQYHFAILQFKWSIFGIMTMLLVSIIPVKVLRQLAFPIFVGSVLLLILVLIPGLGVKVGGAKRWLDFGFVTFQSSEVAKVGLIIYLSALFDKNAKFQPFVGTLGLVVFLMMLQPDLGTTVVIAVTAMTIYFASGAKLKNIFGLVLSGLAMGVTLIVSSPYRRARLMTFLDPSADPLGQSYHIRQIILSLGSGGILGTGIGRSLQKYRYVPEATTDSIFAVIAEETGFIGTLILVGLFLFFAYRGFKIAQNVPDTFMKLVALGITIMIVTQAFMNLSAMGALVPLTGITLPFISYGGSSLLVSLASVGLLLNISRYTEHTHE